jgi:hypothetical protein
MMDKLAALLEKLADVIGIQVNRLWPEVVRAFWWQQVVTAITFPLALWMLYRLAVRIAQAMPAKSNSYDEVRIPYYLLLGALTVLGGVLLICVLIGFGGTVAALINPEGAFVLQKLKGRP